MGRVRAKTCLTVQRDLCQSFSYLQTCTVETITEICLRCNVKKKGFLYNRLTVVFNQDNSSYKLDCPKLLLRQYLVLVSLYFW